MSTKTELGRLIERVHGADAGAADAVRRAVEEFERPVVVQIAGRAGVGKSAVAKALGIDGAVETSAVDNPDAPDPMLDGDVVIYVLAEAATQADRDALATVPAENKVVLLNKADAIDGEWAAALARANEYTHSLGAHAVPLVAGLAATASTASLTPAEAASLRTIAAANDPTITMSSDLFLAANVLVDVRARTTMLGRWGLYGLGCAIDALTRDPDLDTDALTQILYAAAGLDLAHTAVQRRIGRSKAVRGGLLLDSLERLAARSLAGRVRDEIEQFLGGDTAAQLGLEAALACPAITDVPIDQRVAEPAEADIALRLAGWWRSFAAGDVGAPAQRAALRIHHGYVRSWSRLADSG